MLILFSKRYNLSPITVIDLTPGFSSQPIWALSFDLWQTSFLQTLIMGFKKQKTNFLGLASKKLATPSLVTLANQC